MSIETIRLALKTALDFVAEERENRESAGGDMTDYVGEARTVEESLAVALIAAQAPVFAASEEMLALLREFHKWAFSGGHFNYPLGSLQKLCDLIAKAEG